MSKIIRFSISCLNLPLAIFFLMENVATAQITPDRSLPNNSVLDAPGQGVRQRNGNLIKIDGGTTSGSNLFHSFERFSVENGQTAHFNNATNIQNIFSRVTGSSISNIDGILRANGTANLFLLNPNGIIFGEGAQLDLGSSFLGTTADSIVFSDGFEFSANDSTTPLLTVEVPIGLGFNKPPGAIEVNNSGHQLIGTRFGNFPLSRINNPPSLQAQENQNIALIGGEIKFNGGIVSANNGKVEIGSVRVGDVGIDVSNNSWNFNYNRVASFNNINFSQQSLVEAYGDGRNFINVRGQNIKLTDGSVLLLQNQGRETNNQLSVSASESLQVNGLNSTGQIPSGLLSEALAEGKGGDIEVFAPQIIVSNNGGIGTVTYSIADGGELRINAVNNVNIIGSNLSVSPGVSSIFSFTRNQGRGGNIFLNTSNLNLKNNALLGTFVDTVFSFQGSLGQGGNLNIFARNISLSGGSNIGTLTFGRGRGGNAIINADNFIEIDGTNQFAVPSIINTTTFNRGNAGNLTINTSKLVIQNGGGISTSTLASGNGGALLINASESIELNGNSSPFLVLSSIDSSAGLTKRQELLGLLETPTGNAGSVTVNTLNLKITDNAVIGVQNSGTGNAGNLRINAQSLFLDNSASISAATASGQGGDITIDASDIQLNDSTITATAGGTGDGGDITINTDTLTTFNSDITANAIAGNGGNILINAQGLFQSPGSEITASSKLGIDGTVTINTPDSNIRQERTLQPNNSLDSEEIIANSCITQQNARRGSFTNTGNGGFPVSPDSALSQFQPEENLSPPRPIPSTTAPLPNTQLTQSRWITSVRPHQLGDPIIRGNKIIRTPDGHRLLVADASSDKVEGAQYLVCPGQGESQR